MKKANLFTKPHLNPKLVLELVKRVDTIKKVIGLLPTKYLLVNLKFQKTEKLLLQRIKFDKG
jgi:rRNA processing protein Gar1